eukprot:CAMPEP_0176343834 /NCGR_PEP_ID=MMETSP0126-20121128/4224_1 /TAXON_ID=141414 ORGANISM="Strombidinopsis acuminatum, Strain SPMC142" /NCGR_SAMPLE_ID=MMETSP0126 /ASSEMBLY_ACC=CAM_ASM_000229 /LENGTH=39 /DNA_ID= /DNA_START= /DNA_END= /DNA_ORIENTATION=
MQLYEGYAKEVKLKKKKKIESPMAGRTGTFDVMEELRAT